MTIQAIIKTIIIIYPYKIRKQQPVLYYFAFMPPCLYDFHMKFGPKQPH